MNDQIKLRRNRLRKAVSNAGGHKAIADRSGIPGRTLSDYLSSRDMPTSALVALAEACGVTVDWLATGRGEGPGEAQYAPASQTNPISPEVAVVPAIELEQLQAHVEALGALAPYLETVRVRMLDHSVAVASIEFEACAILDCCGPLTGLRAAFQWGGPVTRQKAPHQDGEGA
ncbi:helix-turn-helix domain-containing protein [Acidisoma sp. 7E03]